MRKLTFILLGVFALNFSVYTQSKKQQELDLQKASIIEQRIEIIAEQFEEEEVDYTTLFDELSVFYDNPIDVNNAKKEDLEQIYLLTEYQIDALIDHHKKFGAFYSVYELSTVKGMDYETIQNILPFISVKRRDNIPDEKPLEMIKRGRSTLMIRYSRILEEMEGFAPIDDSTLAASPNKRYLGDANKLYARYRFQYRNNLSFGITGEKDAGEEFFRGNNKQGFDFYSMHLYAKNFGFVKQIALGDYQVQFGQGLVLWSGLGFGKSSSILNTKKNGVGLRPYTSVDENVFMRGGGVTLGFGKINATAFYSHKNIDANLSSPDSTLVDGEVAQITSFQTTGYHRTQGEYEDKNAILETHMGAHVAYKTERLNIGLSGLYTRYNADVQRNLGLYNQFEFNTNENSTFGADYNFSLGPANMFGEVAMSANGGTAQLYGTLIHLDSRVNLSIVHRNYSQDFQGLLSNGLGEASRNQNEKGTLIGIHAKLHKFWNFSGYFDAFKFDWLRYKADAPSQGSDVLMQLNFKPNRSIQMYARFKKRNKPFNSRDDIDDLDFIVDVNQTNVRFHIDYKISSRIRFRNRVEYITYNYGNDNPEKGMLVYQDVSYKFKSFPLNLSFRYALFDTDTYNAKLYAYENDVLYSFSIPAYYYKGTRTYLTARYQVSRNIDVWLRAAQWFYNNQESVSSGLNEIKGQSKTEVKAQIRIKF